jgi:glycosyltransferase involved in cell wall biosynthesis
MSNTAVHSVSVVIPVYSGSATLQQVVNEMASFYSEQVTQGGNRYQVAEVILVDDCGVDNSAKVIREMAKVDERVVPVWLTRNYGQHAATVAGMASSSHEWVVTMDEDGQHNPASIGALIDTALLNESPLVYGRENNREPHGFFRNVTSKIVKQLVLPLLINNKNLRYFSSFRLMTGEVARTVGAFAQHGAYLDIALSWIVRTSAVCDVSFRNELRPQSGYTTKKLISHFLRLVVSSGTRPLRLITALGLISFISGVVGAVVVTVGKYAAGYTSNGWASLFSLILILGGAILLALGVIAEYVGVLVRRSIGLPLYVIGNDTHTGPLHKKQ